MVEGSDLGRFMEPVARALFGEPNRHLSTKTELRFGNNGSLSIDLEKGTAYSHEVEAGGGVLWLLERERKLTGKAAFEFMHDIGCDVEDAPAPRARIVATYDYTDEDGKVLFQVCRLEPKTFRQRAPDGTWKVRGIRQVPYRLPEIIEAIAEEKTIFIVEGEKDVDNLWRWNIPATCNAGGAGKWRPEFAPLFAGADIVVIEDNDQAGKDHAAMVAASVTTVARSVRLLRMPGVAEKGDFTDWRDAGGSIERFHQLVEHAPIWGDVLTSKFGALKWEDIGAERGTVGYTWFVEDIVPMGEITLAYGDSGTGKSFDMFDMAMAGARGRQWNGRNVEPGLVVYVAAEAGKGFAKRKIAYALQHQLEATEPLPFVLLTKRPNFFADDVDALALIEEIKQIARRYNQQLVLIVIDTLSAAAPGMNENASQDVSMVRKRLVMLQEQFSAAVVLVHHKPKNGATPRGHGSLTADFETTIEFETLQDKKTDTGKTIHRGTVRKQREGKSGIFWEFTLPVVEVGKNKWGNPETSCVVEPYAVGTPKAPQVGFHATANEKLFLRALYDALVDHGLPPPVGLPKSVVKVVEQRHVRPLMRDRMIAPHEDSSIADGRFRTAFSRAGTKLRDGGVIGVQGNLLWPTGKPVIGFSETGGA